MGLPFYSKWEEPSHTFGDFGSLKSLATLRAVVEPSVQFMVINLDDSGGITKEFIEFSELEEAGLVEIDATPLTSELEEHPSRELPSRPSKYETKLPSVVVRGIHEIDPDSSTGRDVTTGPSQHRRDKSRLPVLRKWMVEKIKKSEKDKVGPLPVFVQFGKRKPLQIGLVNPKGPLIEFRSVQELEDMIYWKVIDILVQYRYIGG
jgi:hypothetical protein